MFELCDGGNVNQMLHRDKQQIADAAKKKLQVIVNGAQFARQLGIICPLECSCFLSAGNPGL